ncbi:MAG: DUF4301 family protein [Oligoflexales bacterium]|nr:DUF4301 family protein [Oligoflexales bacterium]
MTSFNLEHSSLIKEILAQGLPLNTLRVHARRLQEALGGNPPSRTFSVVGGCRLDNGRLISLSDWLAQLDPRVQRKDCLKTASFIPASGLATRYLEPFSKLLQDLELGNLKAQVSDYIQAEWSLPEEVLPLLHKTLENLDETEKQFLYSLLERPKALFPCRKILDGKEYKLSFLEMKILEEKALAHTGALFFVASPKNQDRYLELIRHSSRNETNSSSKGSQKDTPIYSLVQGSALSTLRFDERGRPQRDEHGELVLAPGGHGTLIHLFPEVKKIDPNLDSIFIRNIDNVVGWSDEVLRVTQSFLCFYRQSYTQVKNIRKALSKSDLTEASEHAASLRSFLPKRSLPLEDQQFIERVENSEEKFVWELLFSVFQISVPLAGDGSLATLKRLFDRPFNILGQVPNTGHDLGGSPLVVESPYGRISVVLELPHVCEQDRKDFLEDIHAVTHFNPVFAICELVDHPELYYDRADSPFWILAKKKWMGKDVYHHESLLYELVGNSCFANMILLEVPRILFNPHKSLSDSGIKSHKIT